MDTRVTLVFFNVQTGREGEITKDNLWQAVNECSQYRSHMEYVRIRENASGKIYDKADILRMIAELGRTIKQP